MIAWRKNVKGNRKIHTVVGHRSPDLELAVMLWLWLFFPCVRLLMNAEDKLKTKWISAGPLEPKDWPVGVTLSVWQLIELGYFTNDCGGGPADQHGRKGNKESSLHLFSQLLYGRANEVFEAQAAGQAVSKELLAAAHELIEILEILNDVMEVFNEGDLKGTDVATRKAEDVGEEYVVSMNGSSELDDPDAVTDALQPAHASTFAMMAAAAIEGGPASMVVSQAATPHTRWNLRTFQLGLNAMFGKDPDTVLQYAMIAITTLWLAAKERHELLRQHELYLAECKQTGEVPDESVAPEPCNPRDWFRMSAIMDRLGPALIALNPALDDDAAAEAEAINDFVMTVGAAMQRWEAEWLSADDTLYDPKTWRGKITLRAQVEPEAKPGKHAKVKGPRDVWMVMGETTSQRFGARCRFGNVEQVVHDPNPNGKGRTRRVVGPRPQEDKPELQKASVVIQWYGAGKVVVSTAENIRLDRAVLVARCIDLMLAGVDVTDEVLADLSQPGNFSYVNEAGEYVHALYFTNYLTNFGNGFRAKPDHQPCRLTPTMLREIMVMTLQTDFSVDAVSLAEKYADRAWAIHRQEMAKRGEAAPQRGGRGRKGDRGKSANAAN